MTAVRRVAKTIAVYGMVACLTVAAFVVLHHFGNRISFELALERFAQEFAAEKDAWGVRRSDFYNPYDYCFVSGAVLAGASPENRHPLRDAVLPKAVDSKDEDRWCREFTVRYRGNAKDYVPIVKTEAEIAATDSASWQRFLPYRFWWGSKAIYGAALSHMSVVRYHEWLRTACYVAYALLAIAVLSLGWRALVVASPVLLFGVGLSAIDHFADVTNGLPYAWAVFAPALLALLLRRRAAAHPAGRAAAVSCFFAGMVQAYFWLLGGNNFLAAALVGLVVWLGSSNQAPFARLAHSMFAALMHVVGFAASLALGLLVKTVAMGLVTKTPAEANMVVERSFDVVFARVARMLAPERRDLLGRELGTWIELSPLGLPTIELLLQLSAFALSASVVVAAIQARRGNAEPLPACC